MPAADCSTLPLLPAHAPRGDVQGQAHRARAAPWQQVAETCGRAGIRAGRAAGLGELEPAGKRGGISRKHCQDVLALSPWVWEPRSSHVLECAPRGRRGWQVAVPWAQLPNSSPGMGMETPPAPHVPPARNNSSFLGMPASFITPH